MKAARLHAFHEKLQLEDVPEPELTGPNDVVVKFGANHTVVAEGGQVAAVWTSPMAREPTSSSTSWARLAPSNGGWR
jgi:hypothetical protein